MVDSASKVRELIELLRGRRIVNIKDVLPDAERMDGDIYKPR